MNMSFLLQDTFAMATYTVGTPNLDPRMAQRSEGPLRGWRSQPAKPERLSH